MAVTHIILEKYLVIMGISLFVSLISMFFGSYYIAKGMYMLKDFKRYSRIEYTFVTGGIYLIFVPILLILIADTILTPLFAISSAIPMQAQTRFVLSATEIVHRRTGIEIYMMLLAIVAIVNWIHMRRKAYGLSKNN